jgi:hypothetical protein
MTDIQRWTLYLTTHPFGSTRVEGPRGQGPIEVVRASEYDALRARLDGGEQGAVERAAVVIWNGAWREFDGPTDPDLLALVGDALAAAHGAVEPTSVQVEAALRAFYPGEGRALSFTARERSSMRNALCAAGVGQR